MIIYTVYKQDSANTATVLEFNTLALAQDYVAQNGGEIFEKEAANRTKSEQLTLDLIFGKRLIEDFLTDNRNSPNITSSQSVEIMTRFDPIAKLLNFGDIKVAKVLIEAEATDVTVFTEERKNKYLSLINAHLEEAAIFAE